MTVLAGQRIRASDFLRRRYIRKGTTESVTSSTTVQDDDHLLVALPVGTWEVEAFLAPTGVTGGDCRVVWSNTGTMTFLGRFCRGPGAGATDILDGTFTGNTRAITSEIVYGTSSTSTQIAVYERILVEVTATGTLQLRWAQGTSSGTATVMNGSSQLIITPIDEF